MNTKGVTAPDFDGQGRRAWANPLVRPHAAGMEPHHLVRAATFPARREDALARRATRQGMNAVAMTVIPPAILDVAWLIGSGAVAAA